MDTKIKNIKIYFNKIFIYIRNKLKMQKGTS